MKYRTIENVENVQLRRERRSALQNNEFPLEDLNGNVVNYIAVFSRETV